MEKVLVESPFAGKGDTPEARKADELKNVEYARQCLHDCFERGEAPYASHLLYTQDGVLDDDIPHERQLGIEAGLIWGAEASKSTVYLDLGLSTGMAYGIRNAQSAERPLEFRTLGNNQGLVDRLMTVFGSRLEAKFNESNPAFMNPVTMALSEKERNARLNELNSAVYLISETLDMELVPLLTELFE